MSLACSAHLVSLQHETNDAKNRIYRQKPKHHNAAENSFKHSNDKCKGYLFEFFCVSIPVSIILTNRIHFTFLKYMHNINVLVFITKNLMKLKFMHLAKKIVPVMRILKIAQMHSKMSIKTFN